MLADGSVAGTTYVGRHVAVLRATKEVGNGWVMDGAPTMLFSTCMKVSLPKLHSTTAAPFLLIFPRRGDLEIIV